MGNHLGACSGGVILAMCFLDRIHGRQSVSTNRLASLKVVIKKVSNAFARNIWYGLHRHITSLGASFFNGHQYGLFSASTSSPFSGTLSSNIGVIKFYNILQAVYAVTVQNSNLKQIALSCNLYVHLRFCCPSQETYNG